MLPPQEKVMSKLIFDADGNLVGLGDSRTSSGVQIFKERSKLKRADSLEFLKDKSFGKPAEGFWNLYSDGKEQKPIVFSTGKSQEDIVKEIIELIDQGTKIIFLRGACGTGKSAIALNIARKIGRTSIVVPVKALQKQYEDDYTSKKYLVRPDGEKLKIAVLTGRDNHDSIIEAGVSCAARTLPDNIRITDQNFARITEYFQDNPLNRGRKVPEDIKKIKRMHIAPANPYWGPIYPAEHKIHLADARKIDYTGSDGRDYIFYHRKEGCSYYDQYLAYKKADVLVFNSAKYMLELNMGRKPRTEIEIFDEGDYFLDSLFKQKEINITALSASLKKLPIESIEGRELVREMVALLAAEETNKRELGIDETRIYSISETKVGHLLKLFAKSDEINSEIMSDDRNYANIALEASMEFQGMIDDLYLTYAKKDGSIHITLASTNIKPKIDSIMNKSKALIFMSGTLHSEKVLRNIFGLKDYKIVEAEPINQGRIEITKTNGEFTCNYQNLRSRREEYLKVLSNCVSNAELPVLVQVHAFTDLPSEYERRSLALQNMVTSDGLRQAQNSDKLGEQISKFKDKKIDALFSTKCTRGVDFPGDTCNSIVFTKYPYPNVRGTFWKILQKTHQDYYWDFYNDSAKRELLQRLYRALRSKDDSVTIISPDIRVLNEVEKLKMELLRARRSIMS